ncbi:hypothetical protein [Paraburkholderia graminis]|uniref:hypothetical protein n=1 Tax=Paraburkholderia graminis TaxID=60548 RepID=UPI000411FA47
MAKIEAYAARPTPLMFENEEGQRAAGALIEFGGWNHTKKTLAPISVEALAQKPGAPVLNWFFDSLAAAAEAGALDTDGLADQLFADSADIDALLELMRDGSEMHWLNDRYFWALQNCFSDEDCTSFDALADAFQRDLQFA